MIGNSVDAARNANTSRRGSGSIKVGMVHTNTLRTSRDKNYTPKLISSSPLPKRYSCKAQTFPCRSADLQQCAGIDITIQNQGIVDARRGESAGAGCLPLDLGG